MNAGQACDFYYDPFAHFNAHHDLICDKVRTSSWQRAITLNPSLFQNRVVLDAGCGLCLFTMFIMQHNPSHCYAIEKSSIIEQSREILSANGFLNRVELIHANVKDVELPQQVDTMICDFVNCCGISDSMLPEFIVLRNKHLKPGGFVFPSHVSVSIAGACLSDYSSRVDYWSNVYGLDFRCIGIHAIAEPVFARVSTQTILTKSCQCWLFESKTIQIEDLDIPHPFKLRAKKSGTVNAFVIWFNTKFIGLEEEESFTTSPYSERTSYDQTVCLLKMPMAIQHSQTIIGTLGIQLNQKNPRNLDLKIAGKIGQTQFSQNYELRV